MPKTNAERCRDYRQKNKEIKAKKTAKSSTERVREFRARRKVLNSEKDYWSFIMENQAQLLISEEKRRRYGEDLIEAQAMR
ncbi:unnamed protein product, partial [Brenthis ino]